jgi:hypothetical protein
MGGKANWGYRRRPWIDELGEKVAMCGEFWGEERAMCRVQELYRIRGRVNAMARAWERIGLEQQLKA